jgi:hypothetical protein
MADIALWMGLTGTWLALFIAVKPLVAFCSMGARILGYPDNVNPLIMSVFLRVLTALGVLFCGAGLVGAIAQRFA